MNCIPKMPQKLPLWQNNDNEKSPIRKKRNSLGFSNAAYIKVS